MTRRTILTLCCLTLVAFGLRALVAFHGGLWSDEALVSNIVAIPKVRAMLDFIGYHESHPPLFYLLLKSWLSVFGNSDSTALLLSVAFGSLIVPAIYFSSRRFFSERAAMIAAALGALSPSLIETSAELRPYGLLPVLIVIGTFCLLDAIVHRNWKSWLAYSVLSVVALYTHHWVWLVLLGQGVAVLRYAYASKQTGLIGSYAASCAAIAILYLPWIPQFLFQFAHAGHSAPYLPHVWDYVEFLFIAPLATPFLFFFGSVGIPLLGLAAIGAVAFLGVFLEAGAAPRFSAFIERFFGQADSRPDAFSNRTVSSFLLTICVTASIAAVVLSIRSFMMLSRCFAMLTPLLLIVLSAWIATPSRRKNAPAMRTGILVFALAVSVANLVAVAGSRRSNAREVAGILQRLIMPTDVLIIAPHQRAPAVNHYFLNQVEQVDYPEPGRSGLIDFSYQREKKPDTVAMNRLRHTIANARLEKRRIWFITARDFLVPEKEPDPGPPSPTGHVNAIRDALVAQYGQPDTAHFERGSHTRGEELLLFLFTPPRN